MSKATEEAKQRGDRIMRNPRPKSPSKGRCPICKWPVKVGGIRKTVKGVRRWYHPNCFKKIT